MGVHRSPGPAGQGREHIRHEDQRVVLLPLSRAYQDCPENALYARVVKLIKNRKEVNQEAHFEKLEQILMDSARAQAVIDASKSSMGMDISPIDLLNIDTFASRMIGLTDYRKELSTYLQSKMGLVAPNLSTLIGDIVGARLISHAGSLTNLAKAPASTVQILGAEKALFRALKTRGNTPKYGLIFHSSFIGRAGAKNKGRISRYLANKCSIASRIDAFSEQRTSKFGEKMKDQVEERLEFYETGKAPQKNLEAMHQAAVKAQAEADAMADIDDDDEEMAPTTPKKEKKKEKKEKKKSKKKSVDVEMVDQDDKKKEKKKKKKRKSSTK